jgi:chorismate synthase
MSGTQLQFSGDVSLLAGIEHQLAAALVETADEIKHVECFDDEQRAEVYAILQALRTDTEAHRAMVELLARQLKRGKGDGDA